MTVKQKIATRIKQSKARKPSKAHTEILKLIRSLGIEPICNKAFIAGNGMAIVDFYLPKPKKLAIIIDPRIKPFEYEYKSDKRDDYLTHNRGISVVHIPEEAVPLLNHDNMGTIIHYKEFNFKEFLKWAISEVWG